MWKFWFVEKILVWELGVDFFLCAALSYDMYMDGYTSSLSVDYSQIVIDQMKAKYAQFPDLKCFLFTFSLVFLK